MLVLPPLHAAGPGNAVCSSPGLAGEVIQTQNLKVLTLNLAHGRKTAMNQFLVSGDATRGNLEEIALLLIENQPAVVALQEADAPSRWSGGFDHVAYLAEASGYSCYQHGHHTDTWMSTFGTALMSQYRLRDAVSHQFSPSPPTLTKGYVRATIDWNPSGKFDEPREVTLISVHLDFSRKKVRDGQIGELSEVLDQLDTPVIVLGDFNADWEMEDSSVRMLVERFGLRAWLPESGDLKTYKAKRRLDWILVSPELEFTGHRIIPDELSDHLAVLAELSWVADD